MFPIERVILTLLLFVSLSPSNARMLQSQETSTQEKIRKVELGSTKNVHQAGNLLFAGQFEPADIKTIRARDIERIITLRTDGEIGWNEQQAVESAGIEFIKVPFRSPESLTDQLFDEVRSLLKDKSKKTLFHCGSANRVGGVWLPYRVLDEKVDLEIAIAEAEEIGLGTPFIKAKALDYIKRRIAETNTGTDFAKSANPEINKGFLDPNLKVVDYLKRFEVESREIFSARENIVQACHIQPGQVVADVGAGTGLFTRLFSKQTGKMGWVFAVDVSPRLVEYVTQEASKLELSNITSVLCATDSVNLPPESVDVVFICDTYHHFEDPKSTMASIHRALRNDGRLIVVDFERIRGVSREWIFGHVRAGKEIFRAEIQDAGFTLVREEKINGMTENYFLCFKKY